jgi:hypothetical protein
MVIRNARRGVFIANIRLKAVAKAAMATPAELTPPDADHGFSYERPEIAWGGERR